MEQDNEVLYRAARIKKQIADLEAEYDLLKEPVMAKVRELALDPDKPKLDVGDLGRFCVESRCQWTYSQATQDMEAALKKVQKEEQQTGIAQVVHTSTLKFLAKKE